jgi:hypothetical protein
MAILSDGNPYTKAIPKVGGGYYVSTAPKASSKSSAIKHSVIGVPAPAPAPVKTANSVASGGGGGGSGGYATVQAPVVSYNPMQDPSYLASISKLNDLWNQANNYKGQLDSLMSKGFSYDPNSDQAYQSLKSTADVQAKSASKNAMEDLNARGILNSTVTSDRLGQIQQSAQDAVTAQIPTLMNSAYGKYMDKVNGLKSLWDDMVGQATSERAYQEDSRRWNLDFDYKKSQDAISNGFQQQQLNISKSNATVSQLAQAQDASGYKNAQATQQALAELMTYHNAADIKSRLESKAVDYANQGVSISDLISSIDKIYPGFSDNVKSSSKTVDFSQGN